MLAGAAKTTIFAAAAAGSGAHGLGLHFTDLVGEGVLRTQTSKGFALRTFKQTDSPPPLGP